MQLWCGGVAEKKSATRMAHGDRGANSREIRSPILFGMARYQRCARARMVVLPAGNVQQQCEWYALTQGKSSTTIAASTSSRCLYSYNAEAGAASFAAIELGSFSGGFEIGNSIFNASLRQKPT